MDWSSITPAVVIAIASLMTASCSFFVALFNYRRSNYAAIRIVYCSASTHFDNNRGRYSDFRVIVQNLGIPLHNIGMSLSCCDPDGFGWGNFPMKTKDGKSFREGMFAKGAITEFSFATDRLENNFDGFLTTLTDLKAQRAELTLHADHYKMWSYRLHDRLWRFKKRWNRFARWLTEKMRRNVTTSRGTKGVYYPYRVKEFDSAGREILSLASMVRMSEMRDSGKLA